ncbi:facilitated trehalose transporter Tret1-like [Eriocheir sinensis]|uniref:facilitated trehalose transporter Tret1-like n=1 Tax=Eriocheir sinensis TaxID=95602 RepID=UPI0021C8A521|nr:facilitated trehalose transporter Tret1-like [Eriocheir sinensis]
MKEKIQGFEALEKDTHASLTQDKDAAIKESKTNDKQEEQERVTACLMPSKSKPVNSVSPALLPQVLGTGMAALAQVDIGAIFSYPGVTLPQLLDETSDDLIFSTTQAALFGSVIYLGAMVGSFLASMPMVRLGQRVTLLIALPLSFASWVTLVLAPSVWMVLAARLSQGLALSLMTSSSTTYVAELAHSSVRGRLIAAMDLSRQMGSLFIFSLGTSPLSWRQVALTAALMNTILPFIGFLLLPNSPRWSATRGRTDDARRSLTFFRGHSYDTEKELDAIINQLQNPSKDTSVSLQLRQLREPAILRYVIIMSVVLFLMHFNGSSVIPAYIVIIMNTARVEMSSYLAAIAVCITKIAGTFCFGFVIDRIDRRPLFTVTCLISAVSMAILGCFFFDQENSQYIQHLEWVPLLCLTTYAFFSASPVIGLLRSELFPTSVRSSVVPILYTTFFVGAFLALQTYPYIVVALGPHGAFWLFSVCNLTLIMIVVSTIPETRGKTLEQITEIQRRATRHNE